jgi:hypothetical protein
MFIMTCRLLKEHLKVLPILKNISHHSVIITDKSFTYFPTNLHHQDLYDQLYFAVVVIKKC